MASFEFEYSQQDKQLTVTQGEHIFGETDYIRLTIYPTEGIDNIVTLPPIEGEEELRQAIFYSSLNEEQFDINISPFGAGLDELATYTIGGDLNDFKIYKNPNDGGTSR